MALAGGLLVGQGPVQPQPAAPPPAVQQVLVRLTAQLVCPHALSQGHMLHEQTYEADTPCIACALPLGKQT